VRIEIARPTPRLMASGRFCPPCRRAAAPPADCRAGIGEVVHHLQPRSSSVFSVVDVPAPDMPVTSRMRLRSITSAFLVCDEKLDLDRAEAGRGSRRNTGRETPAIGSGPIRACGPPRPDR
jgi:hypothetical protein